MGDPEISQQTEERHKVGKGQEAQRDDAVPGFCVVEREELGGGEQQLYAGQRAVDGGGGVPEQCVKAVVAAVAWD